MKSKGEFYQRAVRDTLDSIVSPAARDSVLAEALAFAGEIAVPREREAFRSFLTGPLRDSLERALGRELGASVVRELERLADEVPRSAPPSSAGARRARGRAPAATPAMPKDPDSISRGLADTEPPNNSRPRKSAQPKRGASSKPAPPAKSQNSPTMPARPRHSQPRPPNSNDYPAGTARTLGMLSSQPAAGAQRKLPHVFVVSRDVDLVRRFGAWLDPRAAVVRVLRLSDLLIDLQDAADRRSVVIVDGKGSPIRLEALAAVSDELPESVSVILWGGTPELTARLSDIFPRVAEWLVCTDQTPLADVADRCSKIVG